MVHYKKVEIKHKFSIDRGVLDTDESKKDRIYRNWRDGVEHRETFAESRL